uniref:Uncharacterized protein n=1 Tax=Oryza meridionalis TaxID=40149 RepID=A0A0E0DW45_9ORYZ
MGGQELRALFWTSQKVAAAIVEIDCNAIHGTPLLLPCCSWFGSRFLAAKNTMEMIRSACPFALLIALSGSELNWVRLHGTGFWQCEELQQQERGMW